MFVVNEEQRMALKILVSASVNNIHRKKHSETKVCAYK